MVARQLASAEPAVESFCFHGDFLLVSSLHPFSRVPSRSRSSSPCSSLSSSLSSSALSSAPSRSSSSSSSSLADLLPALPHAALPLPRRTLHSIVSPPQLFSSLGSFRSIINGFFLGSFRPRRRDLSAFTWVKAHNHSWVHEDPASR